MRTLPTVLVVVFLNDLVLAYVLDVHLTPPVVVVGAAGLLTLTIFAAVSTAVDRDEPPTRRELQTALGELRERVASLEDRTD